MAIRKHSIKWTTIGLGLEPLTWPLVDVNAAADGCCTDQEQVSQSIRKPGCFSLSKPCQEFTSSPVEYSLDTTICKLSVPSVHSTRRDEHCDRGPALIQLHHLAEKLVQLEARLEFRHGAVEHIGVQVAQHLFDRCNFSKRMMPFTTVFFW